MTIFIQANHESKWLSFVSHAAWNREARVCRSVRVCVCFECIWGQMFAFVIVNRVCCYLIFSFSIFALSRFNIHILYEPYTHTHAHSSSHTLRAFLLIIIAYNDTAISQLQHSRQCSFLLHFLFHALKICQHHLN